MIEKILSILILLVDHIKMYSLNKFLLKIILMSGKLKSIQEHILKLVS